MQEAASQYVNPFVDAHDGHQQGLSSHVSRAGASADVGRYTQNWIATAHCSTPQKPPCISLCWLAHGTVLYPDVAEHPSQTPVHCPRGARATVSPSGASIAQASDMEVTLAEVAAEIKMADPKIMEKPTTPVEEGMLIAKILPPLVCSYMNDTFSIGSTKCIFAALQYVFSDEHDFFYRHAPSGVLGCRIRAPVPLGAHVDSRSHITDSRCRVKLAPDRATSRPSVRVRDRGREP
jgi:hypothetical protein